MKHWDRLSKLPIKVFFKYHLPCKQAFMERHLRSASPFRDTFAASTHQRLTRSARVTFFCVAGASDFGEHEWIVFGIDDFSQDGVHNGHHHGGCGRVANPSRHEHGGQHETQHDPAAIACIVFAVVRFKETKSNFQCSWKHLDTYSPRLEICVLVILPASKNLSWKSNVTLKIFRLDDFIRLFRS